jgi:hypothetical protein
MPTTPPTTTSAPAIEMPPMDLPAPDNVAQPVKTATGTKAKPVSKAKRTAKFVQKPVGAAGTKDVTKLQIPARTTAAEPPATPAYSGNVVDIKTRQKAADAGLGDLLGTGTFGESINEEQASPVIGSMVQQLRKPNVLKQNHQAFRDAYHKTKDVKLNYGGSANIPLTWTTMDGIVSTLAAFAPDKQKEVWTQLFTDPNYLKDFLNEYVPQRGMFEADVIPLAQQRQAPDQLKAYNRALEILRAAKDPSVADARVNMLKQALFKDFGTRIQQAPDGHYYMTFQGKQVRLPNPGSSYVEETKPATIVNRSIAALKAMPKIDQKLAQSQQRRQELERQRAELDAKMADQEKADQAYWAKNAPRADRIKPAGSTLEEGQRLNPGDPVVVTAPNEFEGKTGEIYELSPSGTFVIVDLYNHGKHSMHLSDVEYNDYADQEETDDWYDEMEEGYAAAVGLNPPAVDPVKHWKNQVRQLVADYIKNPQGLYTLAKQKGANSAEAMAYRYLMNPKGKIDLPPDAVTFEGYVPLDKYSPTAVCLSGKPVKKFDYYKDAENFYKNWKQKLYREGNKEKADKITLMPLNLDEGAVNPQFVIAQVTKLLATEARRITNAPMAQLLAPVMKEYGLTLQQIDSMMPGGLKKAAGEYGVMMKEAGSPAQQAAIAIAMKKAGKKPKQVDELSTEKLAQYKTAAGADASAADKAGNFERGNKRFKGIVKATNKQFDNDAKKQQGVAEDTGSWIVYDPETKQIKKRFKTHTAGKSYARTHGLGFASSEFYFDRVKDNKEVAEGAMSNVHAAMADVYHRLAPKIERHRDSFLAGQLYDELENIAELHGVEPEFKRMLAGARNRAHMDYDTNPGGFQNWFWYLPFEDQVDEQFTNQSSRQNIPGKSIIEGFTILYDRATKKVDIMYQDQILDSFKYTGAPTLGQFMIPLDRKLAQLKTAGKGPIKTKTIPNRNYDQTFTSDLSHNVDLPLDVQKQIYQQHDQDTKDYGITAVANPAKWAAIRRAQAAKRDKEAVTEESSTSSEAVEIAIIKRILVAHTDLIMEFGLDKVTQAIEEVAYNVGDVDEIGSSDVSAYVNQVKSILGAE